MGFFTWRARKLCDLHICISWNNVPVLQVLLKLVVIEASLYARIICCLHGMLHSVFNHFLCNLPPHMYIVEENDITPIVAGVPSSAACSCKDNEHDKSRSYSHVEPETGDRVSQSHISRFKTTCFWHAGNESNSRLNRLTCCFVLSGVNQNDLNTPVIINGSTIFIACNCPAPLLSPDQTLSKINLG